LFEVASSQVWLIRRKQIQYFLYQEL
jgi:hypothetical protein